jgi:hypothetical protein
MRQKYSKYSKMSNPHPSVNITYENDKVNIRVSSEQSVYMIAPNAIYIVEAGKKRKRDFAEINSINPFVKRTRYN